MATFLITPFENRHVNSFVVVLASFVTASNFIAVLYAPKRADFLDPLATMLQPTWAFVTYFVVVIVFFFVLAELVFYRRYKKDPELKQRYAVPKETLSRTGFSLKRRITGSNRQSNRRIKKKKSSKKKHRSNNPPAPAETYPYPGDDYDEKSPVNERDIHLVKLVKNKNNKMCDFTFIGAWHLCPCVESGCTRKNKIFFFF